QLPASVLWMFRPCDNPCGELRGKVSLAQLTISRGSNGSRQQGFPVENQAGSPPRQRRGEGDSFLPRHPRDAASVRCAPRPFILRLRWSAIDAGRTGGTG